MLVDNFNNTSNNQGTGTTIVDVHPDGHLSVFARLPRQVAGCPGGVGLMTAMVQLTTGWVIVGSLPSTNGKIGTAGAGCLLVLSATGRLSGTITGPYLDGPWDETVRDDGGTAHLFVANTLVGRVKDAAGAIVHRGTVVRLSLSETAFRPPRVTAETIVASGFAERADASAFVRGPTGLAVDSAGTLFVADNLANRIVSVPRAMTRRSSAGTGRTLSAGGQLANPLGLAIARHGDLLVANATNGKIVEIAPSGRQVGEYYADHDVGQDPPGNGDLFDVAINSAGSRPRWSTFRISPATSSISPPAMGTFFSRRAQIILRSRFMPCVPSPALPPMWPPCDGPRSGFRLATRREHPETSWA